jgi:HD domain
MSGSTKPDFSDALAVGRALDLTLPDSRTIRDAYDQARAESSPWLFKHVVRSWLYGAKLTQRRGLAPDAELVAVAVLLHDLGLARGGSPDRRFEVVGAEAGRAFALSHDMGERRAETIWDSIALPTTASIGRHKGVDVAQRALVSRLWSIGWPPRRMLCGPALADARHAQAAILEEGHDALAEVRQLFVVIEERDAHSVEADVRKGREAVGDLLRRAD